MPIEIPVDKWSGIVNTCVIGATSAEGGTRSRSVQVGGEKSMSFLHFESPTPHTPLVAIQIKDYLPPDWSAILNKTWGDNAQDPAKWAKAAEATGADLLVLTLNLTNRDGSPNNATNAVATTKAVLGATGLPLMVFGPGQPELDNEMLVPIAEATKGERIVMGICEDKNYRTIVAAALANDHIVSARAAMDVNLSKQLNILISDMGLPLSRLLMDPTTAALGYGMEYGFSVMERLRLAALQGDRMVQLPMIVTPGDETWKTKEAKIGEGVPSSWGKWEERAINWEVITAVALIESGADIVVLRHPESVHRVKAAITELMTVA